MEGLGLASDTEERWRQCAGCRRPSSIGDLGLPSPGLGCAPAGLVHITNGGLVNGLG